MNDQEQPKPRKARRMQLMLALAIVVLLGVSLFGWYGPKVFSFHATVSPLNSTVSGDVFKSSDGVFLVRLDSGSQMTVQGNPPKVFLSPNSTRKGFRIGRYLILSAADIGGVDLSKSESFDKQVPVIGDGKVTLKDPMQRDGSFSFPSGG
jgi:hypothetical protein